MRVSATASTIAWSGYSSRGTREADRAVDGRRPARFDIQAAGRADVWRVREKTRRRACGVWCCSSAVRRLPWYRYLTNNPFELPALGPDWGDLAPTGVLFLAIVLMMLMPLFSGRSLAPGGASRGDRGRPVGGEGARYAEGRGPPHARRVPGLRDVPQRARRQPPPRILFEGPPGTGKTYLAKAMAKQAGVPFLFISAPAFQSMWFGMTGSRSACSSSASQAGAQGGGAIGFIEEIDAIGGDRGGLNASPDGTGLGSGRVEHGGPRRDGDGERAPDPDAVVRPAVLA